MKSILYKLSYWKYTRDRYHYLREKLHLLEEKVDLGGHSIHYFHSKTGNRDLVCLHGLLDAAFGFRRILPHLNQDWKVHLVDIPGFGKSKLPPIKYLYQLDHFVEFIYESIQKKDLRDVFLLGHSMGGLLAQHLSLLDARRDGRIKALILLSPGSQPHPERDEMRKLLFPTTEEEVIHLLRSLCSHNLPDPSPFLKKTLVHAWNSKEYGFLAENTIARESEIFFGKRAAGIQIPTLILSGEKDEITSLKSVQNLSQWIKNSVLITIPEAKHAIHLEFPEFIAEKINAFPMEWKVSKRKKKK